MSLTVSLALVVAAAQPGQAPDQALAEATKAYLAMGLPTDWAGLDKLAGFKWQPTTSELKNCLPNGDCFARQGTASLGGSNLAVVASGARTMVVNLLIRNLSAPIGESAILAALAKVDITTELARCPVNASAGGTNWYRLKVGGATAAVLSIQAARPGRPNEGYIISQGDKLPTLQPNQLAMYSEQCAPDVERKAVSTGRPHEELAGLVVSLLPQAGLYDWKTLATMPTGIRWNGEGPKPADLTSQGDRNPVSQFGSLTVAGREFSVTASGTPEVVKAIYLEESGRHPKGEHMLGVVYQKGIAVRLVRCGPVYTESTNNWYSLTSTKTKTAQIRQSIHYDGNMVADRYALRLDGTLPTRDPRDREPGQNGC